MAKFDEADPRWIVQDRADGVNVNQWHWTERDCLEWSKKRLTQLFAEKVLLDGSSGMSARCTGLESITGEAFLNVRKAKLIPSYELELKIKWTGEVQDGDSTAEFSGKVHFPYIADENHDEDVEVKVLCDTAGAAIEKLKAAILASAKKDLASTIQQFVSELRAGGPEAIGASKAQASSATAAASTPPSTSAHHPNASTAAPAPVASSPAAAAAANGASAMGSNKAAAKPAAPSSSDSKQTLNIVEKFYARTQDLYDCFTVEGRVCAYTQSKAIVEARPGGKLEWFGGSVQGEFVELVRGKRIVMKWKFNNWEDDCYSKVIIELDEPEPGNTILTFTQTGIPHADRYGNIDVMAVTESGWRNMVLRRIKAVFGYGV